MINFKNLINNFWHFGAHSSELSNVGDYIKLNFLGEDVVLYNDGKSIIAFDNICPHRGASFFSENRGNSMAVCKYHGWTIANGKLLVPSIERYSHCNQSFNQFKVEFCGSFIFFAILPKTSLMNQLGKNLFELLESISFDCNKMVDNHSYNYFCNALVAIENALEPDHVPFVHRETLYPLNLINYRNEFYEYNSLVKFDIGNVRLSKGIERISSLFDTGFHKFSGYMSIHIFPFGFISSTGGISYSIQNFIPVSDDLCSFSSKLFFPALTNGKSHSSISYLVNSTIDMNKKIFIEDFEICKRIKYKNWIKLIDGPLSEDEVKIKNFREILRQLN
jgi:nitrite reductase/ring-hydroxylating ferredoxin subunit